MVLELDRGGNVEVIYLDLAKAFYSVPHHRLLLKLVFGNKGHITGLDWKLFD